MAYVSTQSKQTPEPIEWQEGKPCSGLGEAELAPFGARVEEDMHSSRLVLPQSIKDGGQIVSVPDSYVPGSPEKRTSVPGNGECFLSKRDEFLHYRKYDGQTPTITTTLVREDLKTGAQAHIDRSIDVSRVGKLMPSVPVVASRGDLGEGERTDSVPSVNDEVSKSRLALCPDGFTPPANNGGTATNQDVMNVNNASYWRMIEQDIPHRFKAAAIMEYEREHGCQTVVDPKMATSELSDRLSQARDAICRGDNIAVDDQSLLARGEHVIPRTGNVAVGEARILLSQRGVRERLISEIGKDSVVNIESLIACSAADQNGSYQFNRSHLDALECLLEGGSSPLDELNSALADRLHKRSDNYILAKEFLMQSAEQMQHMQFIPATNSSLAEIVVRGDYIVFDGKMGQYSVLGYGPSIKEIGNDPAKMRARDFLRAEIEASKRVTWSMTGGLPPHQEPPHLYGNYTTFADAVASLGK